MATIWRNMGRLDEGIAANEEGALELDPLSLIINTHDGMAVFISRGQNENAWSSNCERCWISTRNSRRRGRILEEVLRAHGEAKGSRGRREKKGLVSLGWGPNWQHLSKKIFTKSGYKGACLQSWLEGLTELSKHKLRFLL